jgi:hypothetical protein
MTIPTVAHVESRGFFLTTTLNVADKSGKGLTCIQSWLLLVFGQYQWISIINRGSPYKYYLKHFNTMIDDRREKKKNNK